MIVMLGSTLQGAEVSDVFVGRVSELLGFRASDGHIRTSVTLTPGSGAQSMTITIDGGELDGMAERIGGTPRFVLGQTGELRRDALTGAYTWTPTEEASALASSDPDDPVPLWYNSRFLACDRGEPILYRVDTNALPTGISPARALQAVATAFNAWKNVSSLRFQFDGCENFGNAAPNLDKGDGRIWIQLHNYGNYLPEGSTIGLGGYYNWVDLGAGGQVTGTNFNPTTWGWVILKHTASTFANNPINFEEVLTHEIGHVLSLHHSAVANSIMRSTAYGSNRGAVLGGDDLARIRAIYPTNTPPFGDDRILRVLSRPPPQITPLPGTNGLLLAMHDLQTTNLTVVLYDTYESGGSFSRNGSILGFTPADWYYDFILDPSDTGYISRYRYRISDGVNLSPIYSVRVIAFLDDSDQDYLADSWEDAYSGLHTSGPEGDKDGDGFNNYQEWLLGTNPSSGSGWLSHLEIKSFSNGTLTWPANPYALYEVRSTTNLTSGFSFYRLLTPTSITGRLESVEQDLPRRFFKVRRVP